MQSVVRPPPDRAPPVRIRDARGDRIHPDTALTEFFRKCLCEHLTGGFTAKIGPVSSVGTRRSGRREIDDTPTIGNPFCGLPQNEERPLRVQVEHSVELLFGGFRERRENSRAGTVDDSVCLAERAFSFIEQPLDVACLTHVGLDGDRFAAVGLDSLDDRLCCVFTTNVVDDD